MEYFQARSSGRPAELVSPTVLKGLRGRFTGATLDYQLPCTAAEGKLCQIFDHLSTWNEFLCQASMQLRETTGTSGNVALVFRSLPQLTPYPSREQLCEINTLVYWLLKTHRCLVYVEIKVSCGPYDHMLHEALQGNRHVRSLRLFWRVECLGRPSA
ncbi:hypothetical protein HPB48_017255 [Haemaphysalis longicornis]|uniref:Uncharacterized protein n=1 Tax=Haemaphysalis longicornis TaxID=44386 RepID=A0A9J6FF92_HAELO|nr:hypothetical protein HPB48_017255 [Haemaphysalis longicornis]